MPVTTQHPQYQQHVMDWQMMSDALAGERAIKDATTQYLPKTSGMLAAERPGDGGESAVTAAEARELYAAYLIRADYPLWVKDSLRAMMGLVSRQEPEIKVPTRLSSLEAEATADGFDLNQLFLRVVSALLTKGRCLLVADFDDAGLPYIALYSAESAINWREQNTGGRRDLTMVVMQEAQEKADNDEFGHDADTVYRVLDLNGSARVRLMTDDGEMIGDEERLGNSAGKNISFLPAVFSGPTDNSPDVDEIPLLTMAKAALRYYQLSADYYTSLNYTAHPQPVVTGLDDDQDLRVTGPMAAWCLPADGDAKYLEFTGAGIEATRVAMRDQRDAAIESGARVMDNQAQESGDARRARQDDQYATLYGSVMQAAEAVEQVMKYQAIWAGDNPDNCIFSIKPEFTSAEVDAAMLTVVGNMTMSGEAPRSVLFEALRKAKITDKTDDELEAEREGGELVDYDA